MGLRAVVFDYGMVLTGLPDAAAHDAMVRITGLPAEEFEKLYWVDRPAYDAGDLSGVAFIDGYRAYLTEVRERTAAEKHAGHSIDQAVQAVTAAFGDRAPDKGRLAGAIRAAYAEAP